MTIAISGAIIPVWKTLTGSSVTTVYDPDGKAKLIASVRVAPTTGTPTVDLSVYDGTTRYYLCKAATTTAAGFTFDGPFGLEPKQVLEAKSSDASGYLDVLVNVNEPGPGRSYPTGSQG